MQHRVCVQITPPIDRPCFNWIIGAAFQVAQSFQVTPVSTATLSAPKTRTARKSASLADLILVETAVRTPAAPVGPTISEPALPSSDAIATQPLFVFMVVAIAVFGLAQGAIVLSLIATKIATFIIKKAAAFATAQMGSKPRPDYSPIFD